MANPSNHLSGPLTAADHKKINKDLAALEHVRAMIEQAAEAGIPCGELDQTCKAAKAQLEQIKKVYFPDLP